MVCSQIEGKQSAQRRIPHGDCVSVRYRNRDRDRYSQLWMPLHTSLFVSINIYGVVLRGQLPGERLDTGQRCNSEIGQALSKRERVYCADYVFERSVYFAYLDLCFNLIALGALTE